MKTKKPQKLANSKKENFQKVTYSNLKTLVKTQLFGVGITNETEENILEYLGGFLQKTKKNMYIVTPNPEMIMLSKTNINFKNALNKADLALCDGMGLYKAGQILGHPFKERIIGTNFMEKLCEKVEDWPITVGFLGGGHGVAEETAECLKARFPGLKVVFAEAEWHEARGPVTPHPAPMASFTTVQSRYSSGVPSRATPNSENTNSSLAIQNTKYQIPNTNAIDILFVAFGAPKQELWMAEHINKIPVRVMMGVGGAFDQIIDSSLRPPSWAHLLGLGWLYRLIRQPWRLKRQLVLIPFMGLVFRERLKLALKI